MFIAAVFPMTLTGPPTFAMVLGLLATWAVVLSVLARQAWLRRSPS